MNFITFGTLDKALPERAMGREGDNSPGGEGDKEGNSVALPASILKR